LCKVKKHPLLAGEGWGEVVQKYYAFLNFLILTFSLKGEGISA
jgi:hypothetical protein